MSCPPPGQSLQTHTTMNSQKTNLIGYIAVVIVIGLILGAILFGSFKSAVVGSTNNSGTGVTVPANTTLVNGYQTPNPSTFDYLVSRGYLVAQNLLGLGNGTSVVTNIQSQRMTMGTTGATGLGTTTPCAFQNVNATSTIVSLSFNITVGTSTAATFAIGTTTTNSAFATSTSIASPGVAASAQRSFNWDGSNDNSELAPNQWVVFGTTGTITGVTGSNGYVFGGTCQMVVQTIN